MYVIKKLRLNRYKPQPIASARSLYARMKGQLSNSDTGSKSTSDCISDAGMNNLDKMQTYALGDKILAKRIEYEKKPFSTQPLSVDQNDL